MKIKFWGVRGSLPAPISPDEVRSKIASAVQRIRPDDIKDADSRERFLASLPEWLFGTTGSNTSCLQVRPATGENIIFDAGSGIRDLWKHLQRSGEEVKEFHIFFSHLHWDHIHGLPFFGPAYNPGCTIHFYSPQPEMESALKGQMRNPYFPITMEDRMNAKLVFHTLSEEETNIGSSVIRFRKLNHPGGAFAYQVREKGKRAVYATDVELMEEDFKKIPENTAIFDDVDVLILDTTYTLGEAIEKYNWGHSSFSLGVDFASAWGVKNLYLFHHEHVYDDKKLDRNLRSARWYANRLEGKPVSIFLAREGLEITV
ncbi:MAG: MBL fold metallo-hydrolase [Spirochaetia bacterium]